MWKIAIIDDDFQVLEGIRKVIPWESLNACWAGEATDGERGLELVRSASPDIILTDIYMPVMDGLEMIKRLREEQYEGQIIILSGYTDFHYARQALQLDVSDYLCKPTTVQEIEAVLQKATSRLEAERLERLELEQLRQKLMLYEPFVADHWLKSIVTGTASQPPLIMPAEDWNDKQHVIAAVEILPDPRWNEMPLSDWHLFKFALHNMIEEIVSADGSDCELIELQSRHSILLFHLQNRQELERIHALCSRIPPLAGKYLKLDVCIGIGTLKQDWRNIADSTEEAFHALASRMNPIGPRLYTYRYKPAPLGGNAAPSGESAQFPERPVQFVQQFAEALKFSNRQKAIELIDAHIGAASPGKEPDVASLRRFARELWTILSYTLFETGLNADSIGALNDLGRHAELLGDKEQLAEWLKRIAEEICASRGWKENAKHKEVVEFMIHYVHEHFAEDITLEDLAAKLYISKNYLNQIFKKHTGETLNNYLIRVRMEKARQMLLEGRDLIYEIAEKVGYRNVPYFSSVFKKTFGLNPSELVKRH